MPGVDKNGLTEQEFLAAYKQQDYPRPSLTADMAVFRQGACGGASAADDGGAGGIERGAALQLLLIRRGGHPFLGCWALPGGFVEPGESCDEAAARELQEETGLDGVALEPFGFYSAPGRDPRAWTVSQAYLAVVDAQTPVAAGDDAAEAQWFAVVAEDADPGEGSDVEGACEKVRLSLLPVGQSGRKGATAPTSSPAAEETLYVEFKVQPRTFAHTCAKVTASNGFAFDHARIIADAYLVLARALPAF